MRCCLRILFLFVFSLTTISNTEAVSIKCKHPRNHKTGKCQKRCSKSKPVVNLQGNTSNAPSISVIDSGDSTAGGVALLVKSSEVSPRVRNYGPGTVYNVSATYEGSPTGLKPFYRLRGSVALNEITNKHGIASSFFRTPPIISKNLGTNLVSVSIVWESEDTLAPGVYEIGLAKSASSLFYKLSEVNIINSSWVHIRGDEDSKNIKIAFVGDRWTSNRAYFANVRRTVNSFISSDPVIENYSPSIDVVARKQQNLSCHHCRDDQTGCGLSQSSITATTVMSALASVAIFPTFISLAVIAPHAIDIAAKIEAEKESLFSCSTAQIGSATVDAPGGNDLTVAYINGDNYSTKWWRSHVGAEGSIAQWVLFYLGLGRIPNQDITFLATEYYEGEDLGNFIYGSRDGQTLSHEFGHSFGGLPDYYLTDENCREFKSKMCTTSYAFADPKIPGWDTGDISFNRSSDRAVMIDAFNRAVGQISYISTGNVFPNPSVDEAPWTCTGYKFQVRYNPNPKQLSYLTAHIYDIAGREFYAYSSDKPAPNDPNLELKFGFFPNEERGNPGNIGLGYPNATIDQNGNFAELPQGKYFFRVSAGNVASLEGNGLKYSYVGGDLPKITDPICNFVDRAAPSQPTSVSAAADSNGVAIGFLSSVDDTAVDHYEIYRRYAASNRFPGPDTFGLLGIARFNSSTVSSYLQFVDSQARLAIPYEYYVVAVDPAGNKSLASERATAERKDLLPPTAPSELTLLSMMSGYAAFSWRASVDNDAINSYVISLKRISTGETIYAGSAGLVASFTSLGFIKTGESYEAQVCASDWSGNKACSSNLAVKVETPSPGDTPGDPEIIMH